MKIIKFSYSLKTINCEVEFISFQSFLKSARDSASCGFKTPDFIKIVLVKQ